MTDQDFLGGKPRRGDHIVLAPRLGDAIGQSLKQAFPETTIPADMLALLGRIDHAIH